MGPGVCLTSDLADLDGRDLRGADGRVARRVGQRLARPDGQLLLLPGGHDLLGDWENTHEALKHVNRQESVKKKLSLGFLKVKRQLFFPEQFTCKEAF